MVRFVPTTILAAMLAAGWPANRFEAPPAPGSSTCGPDPTADGLGACRSPCL